MPIDQSSSTTPVLAIECVTGSSKADEWSDDMLQTGDIVEEIRIGGSGLVFWTPFKNGRRGVQKLLHASYKRGDTSIVVRVRRGRDEFVELQACIVPHHDSSGGGRRPVYVLRSIHDPNYAVGFVDRLENECLRLQGTRNTRVVTALTRAQLTDGYVSYPWEKKMKESLQIAGSSSLLSLLVFPKAIDLSLSRYVSFEDTLAQANAWLNSSQASGVPIMFVNVQAEAMLTKISGETASCTVNSGSLSDLSNLANTSLYGFEDYHGVDIGVMRSVRLWYTPVAGELPIEIKLEEGDAKLGFGGFIYISSVADEDESDLPSTRSGLRELYHEAAKASKLLVISRVANKKILPWMVSTTGAIRCFDTVSLSQKLSLHRHALQPVLIHVLMWDKQQPSLTAGGYGGQSVFSPSLLPADQLMRNLSLTDLSVARVVIRDVVGESSFRFSDDYGSNSWV